jgi:hypothetical protein
MANVIQKNSISAELAQKMVDAGLAKAKAIESKEIKQHILALLTFATAMFIALSAPAQNHRHAVRPMPP